MSDYKVYEFRILTKGVLNSDRKDVKLLNKAGESGWSLAATTPSQFILQRPKLGESCQCEECKSFQEKLNRADMHRNSEMLHFRDTCDLSCAERS